MHKKLEFNWDRWCMTPFCTKMTADAIFSQETERALEPNKISKNIWRRHLISRAPNGSNSRLKCRIFFYAKRTTALQQFFFSSLLLHSFYIFFYLFCSLAFFFSISRMSLFYENFPYEYVWMCVLHVYECDRPFARIIIYCMNLVLIYYLHDYS